MVERKDTMKIKLGARVRALLVAAVLILAIYLVVPVSAKKNSLTALGTIDGYVDAYSSVIVGGHWSVTVKDGVLNYSAMYHELNLAVGIPENSPVGSVDIFTHIFTTTDYEFKGNVLTFTGTMHFWKVWAKLDGTTEVITGQKYHIITITKDTFFLDSYETDQFNQDWDRYGTTTRFQ